MDEFETRSEEASKLRKRRWALVRKYGFPPDALPGCLRQIFRKCGKANCRCARGEGHPGWIYCYYLGGKQVTESVPKDLVEKIRSKNAKARAHESALAELLQINAELYSMWSLKRREEVKRKRTKR